MHAVESVADVEARRGTAPLGPWIKQAIILSLISFLITQKVKQSALISIVFIVVSFLVR
jgi:hypothetical protein